MSVRTPAPAARGQAVHARTGWSALAAVELLLAGTAVVLDLLVPTFILLALAGVSLAVRREGLASLGLCRPDRPVRMAAQVVALTVGWTLAQLALIMPVLNHVTGDKQDLSDFDKLEGNLGQLALLLALTWTIAAFGEEIAYRGYLPTRVTDLLGTGTAGVVAAVAVSSVLFGLAHTEQGTIGVIVTALDAVFFSVLRLHYRTVYASIVAHGTNNTIGLTAYFFVGAVYGLW